MYLFDFQCIYKYRLTRFKISILTFEINATQYHIKQLIIRLPILQKTLK